MHKLFIYIYIYIYIFVFLNDHQTERTTFLGKPRPVSDIIQTKQVFEELQHYLNIRKVQKFKYSNCR